MKIRPAMTGETANGRSMSVIKVLLPRNSNLAIAQAAATPKTKLNGTAMAATTSVNLTAAQAMGSAIAAMYAPTPLASACANTVSSGSTRNRPRNVSATAINSSRPGSERRRALCTSAAAMPRQGPVLQRIDAEHEREGKYQHDHGDGGGAGIVVLLQFGDDQQRRDFRLHRHIACDENHRTILADCSREAQRESGEQCRPQRRQDDACEGLDRRGAQGCRGLLHFPVQILEHGLQSAHHEWQA